MGFQIRSTPRGLDPAAIYGEVVRRYKDFVSPEEFFGNKYALWVDISTSDDDNIHGQGLKLQNTQDGVTLEINARPIGGRNHRQDQLLHLRR